MNVILYPRVSSVSQLKSGDSIDAQIKRLTDFCKQKGYNIYDIYTDAGKSASINVDSLKQSLTIDNFVNNFKLNKRPAFARLLREAKSGKFEAIVFYKWDRFSRDIAFADLATRYFKKYNIKLIPSDDSEDPFVSSLMGVINKQEIDKMKERVRNTRSLRFSEGLMVARPPFGYKLNKKTKIMEINNKEAKIVKKIYNLKVDGKSLVELTKILNISYQGIKNIIKNKVYIGIIQFEGKEKLGKHKPLINKKTFYMCQNEKKN